MALCIGSARLVGYKLRCGKRVDYCDAQGRPVITEYVLPERRGGSLSRTLGNMRAYIEQEREERRRARVASRGAR